MTEICLDEAIGRMAASMRYLLSDKMNFCFFLRKLNADFWVLFGLGVAGIFFYIQVSKGDSW